MKNSQIEYAIVGGSQRFSSLSLRLLLIDVDHRDRFAKLLKRHVELPGANLRTIAELAAGVATCELGINEPQTICRILPGQLIGTRGFASIRPNDHQVSIRFEDACACRIAITTLHEVRHRWQVINGLFWEMYGAGQSEPDAESYADKIARKYRLRCGDCGKSY